MPSTPQCSSATQARREPLKPSAVVLESPVAAVARLSGALQAHQERMQTLIAAEDAVLTRVCVLEQLYAQLNASPHEVATDDSFLTVVPAERWMAGGDMVPSFRHVEQVSCGHSALHTWLPVRPAPGAGGWAPQLVRLESGGLTPENEALYRSLADLVHPSSAPTTAVNEPSGAAQSRDPFLTPEGTELICDGDEDSVVSLHTMDSPSGAPTASRGVTQDLDAGAAPLGVSFAANPEPTASMKSDIHREQGHIRDASEDDEQAPVSSFANLAYAPPSAPLPTTSLSDEDEDSDENVRPLPVSVQPTAIAPHDLGRIVAAATQPLSTPLTNKAPAPARTPAQRVPDAAVSTYRKHVNEINDVDDAEDDDDACAVQSSPSPFPPARPPTAHSQVEAETPCVLNARARTTPSPVQRELDAFFPAPVKTPRECDKRGGDPSSVSASVRKSASTHEGARSVVERTGPPHHAGAPISALDLLARIPTAPVRHTERAKVKSGPAHHVSVDTDDEEEADTSGVPVTAITARRRQAARTARSAGGRRAMRGGVTGLDNDGIGQVRTKRQREADYHAEKRAAREDAALRQDGGADVTTPSTTPPCTPSLYWDTTMPSPYRK